MIYNSNNRTNSNTSRPPQGLFLELEANFQDAISDVILRMVRRTQRQLHQPQALGQFEDHLPKVKD